MVVDFGTGINFDVVSADGEYLGGAIAPGVEISLTALTERGARIPRIELGEPDGGDRQVHARRDPVGRDLRLRRADRRRSSAGSRPSWAASRTLLATGGLAQRDRPVLRDDRRGRRPAHAHRPAADLGAEPVTACRPDRALPHRRRRDPQPRPARAAGGDRQLVRAPAGAAATAPGMAVSEMVSSFAVAHRNRRTLTEMLRIHPDEGPVSIQLFGSDPDVMREAAADGRRRRGPATDRPEHGLPGAEGLQDGRRRRPAATTTTSRVAVARAASEGSGLPVTVKLRSGLRAGRRLGRRARPAPGRRGRGRRRSPCTPAPPAAPHGGARTTRSSPSSSRRSTATAPRCR